MQKRGLEILGVVWIVVGVLLVASVFFYIYVNSTLQISLSPPPNPTLVSTQDPVVLDVDGDTRVDRTDASIVKSKSGQTSYVSLKYDVNQDGNINSVDASIVKSKNGNSYAVESRCDGNVCYVFEGNPINIGGQTVTVRDVVNGEVYMSFGPLIGMFADGRPLVGGAGQPWNPEGESVVVNYVNYTILRVIDHTDNPNPWSAVRLSFKVLPQPACGNYVIESGEECEPPNTATCDANCQIVSGQVCGNGILEGNEVCDSSNLRGKTCESLGFNSGVLYCKGDCLGYDTSSCSASQIIEITGCGTLSVKNGVYILMKNISTTGSCFNIRADGITLDGKGYTITGDKGTLDNGIPTTARDSLTIKNLRIRNFYHGIFLSRLTNSVISNVDIRNNTGYGISMTGYDNIVENSYIGDSIDNSDDEYGIYIQNADYIGGSFNNVIRNNIVTKNTDVGIYINGGTSLVVSDNDITYNGKSGYLDGGVLISSSAQNISIIDNDISSNNYGITGSPKNDIFANNKVQYNSQRGLYLSQTSVGNKFSNNRFCYSGETDLYCMGSLNNQNAGGNGWGNNGVLGNYVCQWMTTQANVGCL